MHSALSVERPGLRSRLGSACFATALVFLCWVIFAPLQAFATRIQPPHDLRCGQYEPDLIAGTITGVERKEQLLNVTIVTDWGTAENAVFILIGDTVDLQFSQRSPIKPSELKIWLADHPTWTVRIWTCPLITLPLVELFSKAAPA